VHFVPRPSGGALYVVVTTPADAVPSRAVLLCPPVFEEHGRAYPVLRELSRRLGARGVATLRFDYVGIGESSADPDVFTMSGARSDISLLAGWLGERFPGARIVPLGVRFGARLVLDALAERLRDPNANIETPILWDPVLDAREYILGELRSTIAGAMVVYQSAPVSRDDIVRETLESGGCERGGFKLNQIDGYLVTRELLEDAEVQGTSAYTYSEPVFALISASSGDGERQKKQLTQKLSSMTFKAVKDDPYWNQPPTYSQVREHLFAATEELIER
jgi:hypothetical protein